MPMAIEFILAVPARPSDVKVKIYAKFFRWIQTLVRNAQFHANQGLENLWRLFDKVPPLINCASARREIELESIDYRGLQCTRIQLDHLSSCLSKASHETSSLYLAKSMNSENNRSNAFHRFSAIIMEVTYGLLLSVMST